VISLEELLQRALDIIEKAEIPGTLEKMLAEQGL
jgi:hypothetical protein